jgi:hypothetical protein
MSFSPVVARVVLVIVIAVMPVIIVCVMSRRRWRCDKASHCTHGSADRSAERRTVTASSGSPNCSAAAGTDETAANHPLDGIVWIGASR